MMTTLVWNMLEGCNRVIQTNGNNSTVLCDRRSRKFHGRPSARYQAREVYSLTQFNKLEASEVGRPMLKPQVKNKSLRDTKGFWGQSRAQRSRSWSFMCWSNSRRKHLTLDGRATWESFLLSRLPSCWIVPMLFCSVITCHSSLQTPTDKFRRNT